jgi:hypothetical protein
MILEGLGLQAAQEGAVAATADRVLIPIPGGLATRVAWAHDQIRRIEQGLEPLPEEGVLWRVSHGRST